MHALARPSSPVRGSVVRPRWRALAHRVWRRSLLKRAACEGRCACSVKGEGRCACSVKGRAQQVWRAGASRLLVAEELPCPSRANVVEPRRAGRGARTPSTRASTWSRLEGSAEGERVNPRRHSRVRPRGVREKGIAAPAHGRPARARATHESSQVSIGQAASTRTIEAATKTPQDCFVIPGTTTFKGTTGCRRLDRPAAVDGAVTMFVSAGMVHQTKGKTEIGLSQRRIATSLRAMGQAAHGHGEIGHGATSDPQHLATGAVLRHNER